MLDLHDPNEQAADRYLAIGEQLAIANDQAIDNVDHCPPTADDVETAWMSIAPETAGNIAKALAMGRLNGSRRYGQEANPGLADRRRDRPDIGAEVMRALTVAALSVAMFAVFFTLTTVAFA